MTDLKLLSDDEVMGGPAAGSTGGLRLLSDDEVSGASSKKEVSLGARVGVGANRAIATMAGAPVDAATFLINKQPNITAAPFEAGTAIVNRIAGTDYKSPVTADGIRDLQESVGLPREIKDPIGGSGTFKRALGVIGANPDDVRPAETAAEKILEATGEGVASTVLPGAALARATSVDGAITAALQMVKGTGPTSNAVLGAASGAGAEAAMELAPDRWKPAAALGGGLAAGAGAAGVMAAGSAAAGAGRRLAQAAFEPAEMRAARTIEDRATSPGTFRQNVVEAAEAPDLVDGSRPTTFQATGDLGVGALEREVAVSPRGVEAFAARRQEQNAARLDSLATLTDENASPDAVKDFVRSRLQALTDEHAGNVSAAREGTREALEKAGGNAFDNAADYGTAQREALLARKAPIKREEGALWDAIDPDGTETVREVPIFKQAVADIYADIGKTAKKPPQEEEELRAVIQNLGSVETFREMTTLRSRITDDLREVREGKWGDARASRRLGLVLKSLDEKLTDTVGEIAADQQKLTPLVLRLRADADGLVREVDSQSIATGTGTIFSPRDAGLAPGAPGVFSSAVGGEGQAGGRSGVYAGDQGLPSPDGGVLERYATARAATKDLKSTFEKGPVGEALKPGPDYGSFKMTASNVAGKLFDRPENLEAYVKASGGEVAALAPMADYAAFSLRQAAVKDGMLSPAKLQNWIDDHQYVFRQFPELEAKFADARTAQSSLDSALARQKQALGEYQTGAVKNLLDGKDPVQVVGSALSRPNDFAALVDVAKASETPEAAVAGLKRATIEHLMSKSLSTAEAGTSGDPQIKADTLQKLLLQNRKTLGGLFDKDELASMDAVAADLRRANRSIVAVKVPGGSNTAQDTATSRIQAVGRFLAQNAGKGIGALGGATMGDVTGLAGGAVIGGAVDAMMAARNARIDKAVVELMLNPKEAAVWLNKLPTETGPTTLENFARRVRVVTGNQVMEAIEREGRE